MAITKVINDAVNLNQTSDYSGLKLPVGTTEQQGISFNLDYPTNKLNIYIIDDGSIDKTQLILERLSKSSQSF